LVTVKMACTIQSPSLQRYVTASVTAILGVEPAFEACSLIYRIVRGASARVSSIVGCLAHEELLHHVT